MCLENVEDRREPVLAYQTLDSANPIAVALLLDFGGAVRISGMIELRPALLRIGLAARHRIDAVGLLEDHVSFGFHAVIHTSGDQRATAANTFSIDMGLVFRDAGIRQCADEATSRTTGNRASDGASDGASGSGGRKTSSASTATSRASSSTTMQPCR